MIKDTMKRENANRICAIVVTFNRLDMLQQCINALLLQTVQCDVLVVDNCSNDGTFEYLSSLSETEPRLRFFKTEKNIGGAGGFNFGMKKAVEIGYEYVWLMDDDCICEPDCLEKFICADGLLKGNYGYLSSAVMWKDDTECIMNRQKISKKYYEDLSLLKEGIIRVEQSTFVSLFVPKQTISRIGFPIKDFFIWGDDIEFTRRITVRNKIESYLVGNSCVHHLTKTNVGSNIATDEIDRISRYEYAFRNEAFLYRKEGLFGIMYYCGKRARDLIRIVLSSKNNRFKRFSALMKGVFRGLIFNPEIEKL